MAKDKTIYACNECGATSARWLGKCPGCGAWNSLLESVAEAPSAGKNRLSSSAPQGLAQAQAVQPLCAIEASDAARTQSGIEELGKKVDSLIIIPNDKLIEVLGDDIPLLAAYAAANDVLHGAVSGIAEVINNPGLVNVDFADVRTVMGEVGMAMMGSATAAGVERGRLAAEQAVKSPLLEDVNLAGARGVLVNVTASQGLKMKEYYEVMNTIKEFTADDAMVIVGTVIDESMGDDLRVTMIATGLGGGAAVIKRPPKLEVLETMVIERTGTDGMGVHVETIDYDRLDQPAVMRKGRAAPASAHLTGS